MLPARSERMQRAGDAKTGRQQGGAAAWGLACLALLPPRPLLACRGHASGGGAPAEARSQVCQFTCDVPPPNACPPHQAGIEYEYTGLEGAVPKKAKKTKFDD